MNCSICKSHSTELEFKFTEKLHIFSCSNCGVHYLHPQLSDAEITELYSENYYKAWGVEGNKENEGARQMKIATFLLRLQLIKKFVPSGNILDIGCATGYFLEAAKTLHYEVYGIELSEYSSSIAKAKFGEDSIFNGKLEDSKFTPGFFQIITMFDLIEHVRSPEETLLNASKLLDKTGAIVITTPNVSSISNFVMGKRWAHYKKEHFFYFNLKSLRYLSKKTKLEIAYSEKSKKALNLNYLHTQFNVYKHPLLTPLINFICFVLPKSFVQKNFYFGIGELTVVLKRKV